MEIRDAQLEDRKEIVELYQRSQAATGLPDFQRIPPSELGDRLYARHAIRRFVATEAGKIIGHGLVEIANPLHLEAWRRCADEDRPLVEMGGAFVEPADSGRGIWTALLRHRLSVVRNLEAMPVTATWAANQHVARTLCAHGGFEVGSQATPFGDVRLFVFQNSPH